MTKTAKEIAHVRWMIRRDMPSVLRIENESFEFPWTEDEFIQCLRRRDVIGMVAEVEDEAVGFMLYELHRTHIHVLNFAVGSKSRRVGHGTRMVEKLTSKLAYRRTRIVLEVRETNFEAQKFFSANGFRATGILKDFYKQCPDEDSYIFQYRSVGFES